jgi:predicted nucleic acid-binding protein
VIIGTTLLNAAVLVDTGAFRARADPADTWHRISVETFEGLASAGFPLIVTRPTIWEAYTRIRYDLGYQQARELLEFIPRRGIEIVEYESADDGVARTLLALFHWSRLSFVDALNFAIAQRLGVRTAFTYDIKDYSMVGLEVIPQVV